SSPAGSPPAGSSPAGPPPASPPPAGTGPAPGSCGGRRRAVRAACSPGFSCRGAAGETPAGGPAAGTERAPGRAYPAPGGRSCWAGRAAGGGRSSPGCLLQRRERGASSCCGVVSVLSAAAVQSDVRLEPARRSRSAFTVNRRRTGYGLVPNAVLDAELYQVIVMVKVHSHRTPSGRRWRRVSTFIRGKDSGQETHRPVPEPMELKRSAATLASLAT
uniref:Uncharacterized protein n=1 Tax=Oryzias melastigma TaxID=30732 RepID=A0A3B3CD60_ORYME